MIFTTTGETLRYLMIMIMAKIKKLILIKIMFSENHCFADEPFLVE